MKEKQQIIHIHGGESWKSYNEYISFLKDKDFDPYKTNKNRWNRNHYNFLNEAKYEVFRPDMPCSLNSKYFEWKIWFEKIFPFLKSDIILIGHSLGGVFLTKYLSENDFKFKIKQIHLVAPVYNMNGGIGDFILNTFPGKFMNNISEVHIYHSEDDTIVPISESEKYYEKLPKAKFHRFKNRGHFLGEDFPELFEIIKKS
jgi:predicted alpha/beta hydrolase family esterase